MRNENTKLQQVLYGYSDGHRLLEASIELPKKGQRTMLVLSDMSGPSMLNGFEEYLTGYPLSRTDSYAFSKTWYAPEMDRPGCVWTHTLIIGQNLLREIHNLSVLLRFFKRPSDRMWRGLYKDPIPFDDSSSDISLNLIEYLPMEEVAKQVLFALYGISDCPPVVLPADGSNKFTKLALALWSQQWPNLRSTFTFCTGAISSRPVNGETFDLQIVPRKVLRKITRDIQNVKIIEPEDIQPSIKYPEWVVDATKDLFEINSGELRKFMWDVDDELHVGRNSFAKLSNIFKNIRSINFDKKSVDGLLQDLAKIYPSSLKGKNLKTRIFGPFAGRYSSILKGKTESDILRILAFTKHHSIFSPEILRLRSRAKSLWERRNEEAVNLVIDLIGTDINPLGEEILLGISEVIQTHELLELSNEYPGLQYVFVDRNPDLASHKGFWSKNLDNQRELLDHLGKRRPLEAKTIEGITHAMLNAQTASIADDVYDYFGNDALHAMLSWFDKNALNKDCELLSGWRRLLNKAPDECLSWLSKIDQPKIRIGALIASSLNPHSKNVKKFGTKVWLRVLKSVNDNGEYESRRALAEFLFPFSLDNPGPDSDRLIAFSFGLIYEALSRSELRYDSWKLLDPKLPQLPWYRSWDKCERLRLGLIDSYIRHNWRTSQFLKCATKEHLFKQLIKSARSTKKGQRFLKKVISDVDSGEVKVNENQRILLKQYYLAE